MSANDDLERRIAAYYSSEAPTRAPDWVLESALATVEATRQRRALIRVPRRFINMNSYAKLAIAAVAVIALGAVGLAIFRPDTGQVGGPAVTPTASPTPILSPSPSPTPLPALTETFTSAMNGISISYPAGWTIAGQVEPWTSESRLPIACDPPCEERINEKEGDSAFISVTSQPLGAQTGEQWATKVMGFPDWGDTCAPQTEPISIDGAPGMIVSDCPEGTMRATAWSGDRGYLIALYRIDDLAWFNQVLATIRLDPEGAVTASPSVAP